MARASLNNIMHLIEDAKQAESPENSFLYDLERSMETDDANNRHSGSKSYKPSGMNCMRQSYYVITGAEQDREEKGYAIIGICNSGSDIHIRVQKAVMGMQANGYDCEWVDVDEFVKSRNLNDLQVLSHTDTETHLYNTRYNISFMCDGIIRYKGKYYILELKTEMSRKWSTREEVNPAHYNQAITYSLSFGLDDVLFVYISRDVLTMKAFMFHVTDEMRDGIVDYINTCDSYIATKQVPPKAKGTAVCKYCLYKTICRKEE